MGPSLGPDSGRSLTSAYIGGVSDLGERLRARGKRLTSQRERVLGAVGALGHGTPDEIVDAVARDGGGGVPASTVYRALDALQELGLVGHTHVDHRAPSYHLAEHATHLHVVCRGCGWVGEAPLAAADELVARLDESLGFASDVSHAAVHGLCRSCREGAPPESRKAVP
jgi:Fur family transcriptional regulator, ferric uptake regulator